MVGKITKITIFLSFITLFSNSAGAESLFQVNASQAIYRVQPKSLFSTIRAKTIGDVITVIVKENSKMTNNVALSVKSGSEMADSFSSVIEDIFSSDRKDIRTDLPDLDGFGGDSQTKNDARLSRQVQLSDTITTQVVQVLPNGNLVIQGKKTAINAGEKTQIILSGIIDPRFITNTGTVESQYIANLQLAVVGNGTISRHDSESIINRIFSHLF